MRKKKQKMFQVLLPNKPSDEGEFTVIVKIIVPLFGEPEISFSRSVNTDLPLLYHVPPDAAAYVLKSDSNLVKYALFGKVQEEEANLIDTATPEELTLYNELLVENKNLRKQAQHTTNRLIILRKVVRIFLNLPDETISQTEQEKEWDFKLKKIFNTNWK